MDGIYSNISLPASFTSDFHSKSLRLESLWARKGEPFQLLIYNTEQEHILLHSI